MFSIPSFAELDFEKAPPDSDAFDLVPAEVVQALRGRRGAARLALVALSRLMSHARLNDEAAVLCFPNIRSVEPLAEDEFCISQLSIAEDVYMVLYGERLDLDDPKHKRFYEAFVKTTMRVLTCGGWVAKLRYAAGDKLGKYGTVWSFLSTPLEGVRTQTIGAYMGKDHALACLERGEPINPFDLVATDYLETSYERYSHAEACVSIYQRGHYLNAEAFRESVAEHEPDQDRYQSVGTFRAEDCENITTETPCAVPYVVLEPEEGDIVDRYRDMRAMLRWLEQDGVDLGHLNVMFSGNQSFHLRIPSGSLGNVAFKSVEEARTAIGRFAYDLFEGSYHLDTSLFDPRHLLRMVGSVHQATGGRVVAVPADQFMDSSLAEVVYQNQKLPRPEEVEYCPVLAERFHQALSSVGRFWIPAFEDCPSIVVSGAVSAAREGVAEGEDWHPKHTGRNKAAFVMACHFLGERGDKDAFSALEEWNQKNDPPLSTRELMACFRSAERTLGRTLGREAREVSHA